MACGGNTFAKTICSICYEDLNPITEDLQSISICGHVFHELCIQQWFEYCSSAKKKNCPVCKQICSEVSVNRLYFQSVGDQALSQKPTNCEENPGELSWEIEKLEGKILGLRTALEHSQNDVKEIKEELSISKKQTEKEAALKNEAVQQKVSIQQKFQSIQQLLHLKSEELAKKTLDSTILQQRNMALAKELAELKLACDWNLEKEELLKLASLGNKPNNKDEVSTLAKTLEFRNKCYKDLMAKFNGLGSSLRKLEKKKRKITRLKARIQELEVSVEVKDNEILRALKASKKATRDTGLVNDAKRNTNSSSINKNPDYLSEEPAQKKFHLDLNGSTASGLFSDRKIEKLKPSKDASISDTIAVDKRKHSYVIVDDDEPELYTVTHDLHDISQLELEHQIPEDFAVQKSRLSKPKAVSDTKGEVCRPCDNDGVTGSNIPMCDMTPTSTAAMDEDTVLILDDIKQVQSSISVEQETPSPVPTYQPGDLCFTGGLLGPDGTKRHLGKWCKRVQGSGSVLSSAAMQGSSASSGNLVAVGADGKGGKIKVLRSLNQSSLDNMETSTAAKRCKYGAKSSTLPSQGSLQIEHFFRRTGRLVTVAALAFDAIENQIFGAKSMDSPLMLLYTYGSSTCVVRVSVTMDFDELVNTLCAKWKNLTSSSISLSYSLTNHCKCMLESQDDFENMLIVVCPLGLDRIDVAVSRQGSNLDYDEENSAHSAVRIVTSSSRLLGTVTNSSIVVGSEATTVGQVFPGGANEFRTALKKYAIEVGLEFKYVKNDGARITAECANKDRCQWRVHASIESANGYFYIRKLCNDHNCGVAVLKSSNKRMSSDLVAQAIVGKHLKHNLRDKFSGRAYTNMFSEKIVNKFTECAYAATQPSFHRKLNVLKAEGGQVVVEFLKTLPFKNWANAYFPGKRYGEMYSNVAECFNNWIEEAREQPATKLVDTIQLKIMKMRTNRRAIGSKWKKFLTKDTENKLEMSYNKTRTWNIRQSTEYLYEVNSDPSVTVDLENCTCSCRWWQIDGLSCDHAVAVIQKTQHNLNSFVEPFFHTEMYCSSYSDPIFPIPNIDKPETTSQNMLIRPPLCKKPAGRPTNKRIPSRGECTRRMRCSRCGGFGNHNKRTCKEVMQ
ncbi:hypothetical protein Vadar_027098 [Vaccinium darrowii]|uniref:Uncharacterized protein n=1 Tax=Vaccinium darrowii TaxID=229202 RepID=A0ACB7ZE88_9ERIC|nr:hypothetical protein Vadar_027098 [Vaccinium darrowii]